MRRSVFHSYDAKKEQRRRLRRLRRPAQPDAMAGAERLVLCAVDKAKSGNVAQVRRGLGKKGLQLLAGLAPRSEEVEDLHGNVR